MFNRKLLLREVIFLRLLGISDILDYIGNLGVVILSAIICGLLGVYGGIHILEPVMRILAIIIIAKYFILFFTISSQELFTSKYIKVYRNKDGKGRGDYITFRNGNRILRRLRRNSIK